ncbi:beta-mannosidase [Isoptericola jiangsuensis]|uniref:beta-mannosidase n=1 Tax=Isoptericola jiangsuensis TaxID=548579 RepID=A0A2A9F048_9MICO|nr:glycoside hydrolase family 2 protein [Isoptericola jiangsuensis]PFG43932.1 beta-mannosidase [Isoptericola jiangsuensis]
MTTSPSATTAPLTVREIHGGWTVRAVAGPVPASSRDLLESAAGVPATVPGTVHTDLLAAGAIPDPYLDDHEALLKWVGHCAWEYRTAFDWAPDGADRHDLAFDGIDTVAVVRLNGVEVARTENMHRRYRFDVTDLLREGANELVVEIASPVREADARSLALGYRPQVNHHPFNALRKAAYNYGWDWGIDAATVGLWRPVRLESWTTARFAGVRVLPGVVRADDGTWDGTLDVHVDAVRAPGGDRGELHVRVAVTGHGMTHEATGALVDDAGVVRLRLPDVAVWWPRGYGDQPLHDVEVTLVAGSAAGDGGTQAAAGGLDRWHGRTGFRSVRLDTRPDDDGTSFTIVVNDRPVWVKGANWIPDDEFLPRVTRERLTARLDQSVVANVNLLRVWGGGVYESDDFYDLCDERGVLTWQDFPFACAAYAEDEPLWSEVEAEARDNVARLSPHPSLVLWNGSNENVWGHRTWGWVKRLDGRTWGLGYYEDLLPRVVAELDGTRPYTPSSPWSGDLPIRADLFPNDPAHGSMHSWEVWNREDWPHYRDVVPRFMAEFGWQGPPTWSTLTRAVSDDPLTPESPGMQVHQKAASGNDKLTDGLVAHLRLPDDMVDWHWAMSWNQATAVQVAVEHLRSWAPRCQGSVVWQLNDCWPVTSWAAVDGDGRAKPLLHALAHAHADRLVTVQPRSAAGGEPVGDDTDVLAVVLVNDTDEDWAGELVVRRLGFDGTVRTSLRLPVEVPARGTRTLLPDAVTTRFEHPAAELLVADLDGSRGLWFPAEPRDSALAVPHLATEVLPADGGVTVRVTAANLVRDLTLLVDKVCPDAVVDDMLVTLLPGESVDLHVTLPVGAVVNPDALVTPDVLRSLNQLVEPA